MPYRTYYICLQTIKQEKSFNPFTIYKITTNAILFSEKKLQFTYENMVDNFYSKYFIFLNYIFFNSC